MKRNTDIDYWPEHLRPIFTAIGAAMAGRRLQPDVLEHLDVLTALPGHAVSVEHQNHGAGSSGNHYVIEVSGSSISGRWPFRSGELETLARTAYATDLVG